MKKEKMSSSVVFFSILGIRLALFAYKFRKYYLNYKASFLKKCKTTHILSHKAKRHALNIHYLDLTKNITLKYGVSNPILLYFTIPKELYETIKISFEGNQSLNYESGIKSKDDIYKIINETNTVIPNINISSPISIPIFSSNFFIQFFHPIFSSIFSSNFSSNFFI